MIRNCCAKLIISLMWEIRTPTMKITTADESMNSLTVIRFVFLIYSYYTIVYRTVFRLI